MKSIKKDGMLMEAAVDFLFDLIANAIVSKVSSIGKNTSGKITKETLKQHLPNFLGLGKADEAIWARLLELLEISELGFLTKLLNNMTPYQRDQFRLIVTRIPVTGKDKDGKDVLEFSGEDSRVKFLRKIIKYAKDGTTSHDVKQAINALKTHRLVPEKGKSVFEKAEDHILDFLGISSWDEITDDHFAVKIESATRAVETFREERRSKGFFNTLMKKFKLKEVSNEFNQGAC